MHCSRHFEPVEAVFEDSSFRWYVMFPHMNFGEVTIDVHLAVAQSSAQNKPSQLPL